MSDENEVIYHVIAATVFVATFALIVQLATHVIPVEYAKALAWSFREKRFLLPILSPLLLIFAAVMAGGSFGIGASLAAGSGSKVFVVGATQDTMFYVDADRPEGEPRTQERGPVSIYKRSQYPAQNFGESFYGMVFVRTPWNPDALVIPHHVALYLFLHFLVLLFVVLAWGATTWLLMEYAVEQKILPKALEGPELAALFLQKTGVSLPMGIGLLALVLAAVSVAYSFLDNRYDQLREEVKTGEKLWRERILSQIRPGTILTGCILQKDRFAVTGYRRNPRTDHDMFRETPTETYRAYLVKFDSVAPFPIFVNVTEYDNPAQWDAEDKARIAHLDDLLASKEPGRFVVREDLSVSPDRPEK